MKKLLLLFVILCAGILNAQVHKDKDEMISLVITQDVKLALTEDNHGNEPFTTDVRITMLWKGRQGNYGNVEVRSAFEYADLSQQDYMRWSGGVGYSFNYLVLPWTNYKYAIAPFVNIGVISRDGSVTKPAFEFGTDIKFPVSKRIKLVNTVQWTDRNDIDKRLNSFDAIVDNFNWSVGLEIIIY